MMLKHYSPKAKFLLFNGDGGNAVEKIKGIALQLADKGYKVGIMTTDEDYELFKELPMEIELLGSRDDLAIVGQVLFAKMRTLDKKGVDLILMRSLPKEGLGLAIADRLFKAAEQQVVDLDEETQALKIINKILSLRDSS
jgi:L-threonylcarbamoyladenylate synthase